MHFTSDNKLNTIHDINTYVKSGKMIEISKDKKMIKIIEKILGEKVKVRNIEFFLKPKKLVCVLHFTKIIFIGISKIKRP